jgi:hypothetical protein
MRKWMTLKEAARASGMSPVLVLALCRSGIVLAEVRQGRWWVHAPYFKAWMLEG